jgi:hypothetical protein
MADVGMAQRTAMDVISAKRSLDRYSAVPDVNISIDIDWKMALVFMLWHFGQRLL